MNKRKAHHVWTKVRPISYWYFVVAAVVFSVIFILAYRQNNIKMLALRDAVFVTDEQGGDINKALNDLRGHVYAHMNTDLDSGGLTVKPPIQLKFTYERLVKAEQDKVSAANSVIYNEAQQDCERRFPVGLFGSGRIPCIEQYLATHPGPKATTIPKELYQFDFVSPRWSPDLAGWSLVAASFFTILAVSRFTLERWLKGTLRGHN